VAGAVLGLLQGVFNVGLVCKGFLDGVGAMSYHDNDAIRGQLPGAVDDLGQHGLAGQCMQYFGQIRLHAFTHACCENDDI